MPRKLDELAKEEPKLSDSQMIYLIRDDPDRRSTWDFDLTKEQRREVLRQLGGDAWHLDEVLEEVLNED